MAVKILKAAVPAALGNEYWLIEDIDQNLQTVSASACNVRFIEIDNSNNDSDLACLKFYDAASPTVGTSDPDLWVTAQPGEVVRVTEDQGFGFSTACKIALVNTKGTLGSTPPANRVDVKVYI